MKIRSVLFDLDGTLFDTQRFHAEAESVLMEMHDMKISAERLTSQYAGRTTELIFMEVLGCNMATAKMLAEKKWEQIIPRAAEAKKLCNVHKLFMELSRRGIHFGIGTASPQEWAWKLIKLHCPANFFTPSNVLCGDQIRLGKPDPEIWMRLSRNINPDIDPDECLVIEDGIAGIEGAVSARMHSALLLPKKHPKAMQIKNVSDVLKIIW